MHSGTLSNTLKKVLVLFGDKIVITFLHAFDHSCCLNRIITFSFLFFLVGCFCLLLLSWLALEKKKRCPTVCDRVPNWTGFAAYDAEYFTSGPKINVFSFLGISRNIHGRLLPICQYIVNWCNAGILTWAGNPLTQLHSVSACHCAFVFKCHPKEQLKNYAYEHEPQMWTHFLNRVLFISGVVILLITVKVKALHKNTSLLMDS